MMSSRDKISPDLFEHLEENVEASLMRRAMHVISNLPRRRTAANTRAVTSAGASVTIIPMELPDVYQAFISPMVFDKIVEFYDILRQNDDPRRRHIVPGRAVEPGVVEYKKIKPLNAFEVSISDQNKQFVVSHREQIQRDITNALAYLHELGITHGDPRMDNIGYDEQYGIFVLFDFDKVKLYSTMGDVESDEDMFSKSLLSILDPRAARLKF
jgi:serine/threonine protein kinase